MVRSGIVEYPSNPTIAGLQETGELEPSQPFEVEF